MADPTETRGADAAALTSMLLIAQQVAGKAARDALFLSSFRATSLPFAMAAGAGLSLVAVYGLSRWMAKSAPAAIMPLLFGTSAIGYAVGWLVTGSAPRVGAVMIYLQTALLGPALISTFWSLINERFDPHTAKRAVARISGGGTLGGVLGGLLVWRLSAVVQPATVLLLLALANALAVVGAVATRSRREAPTRTSSRSEAEEPSALQVLQRAPFLRNLALLVGLGSAISALLDYLFSAEAAASLGKGQPLLSFFSLFWLGVAVLSFVLQLALGKIALEKLNLAINIAILPGIIILGGALGLAVPGLGTTAMLRGAEAVQRNTLFRSAYELLYTPVPEASKRVTKAVIDVGFDRMGTILGSSIALAVLGFAHRTSESLMLAAVVVLALATLPVTRRLHAGYLAALQESLRAAATDLSASGSLEGERLSLGTESLRSQHLVRDQLIEQIEELQPGGLSALVEQERTSSVPKPEPARATDALESPERMRARVQDLLSTDAGRIRRALVELDSRGPGVACAILLLARPDLHDAALTALRGVAGSVTGQLLDALLDSSMDFRVRRKLPRALEVCKTQRAADGLLLALTDERFEVRYACGRALFKMTAGAEPLEISAEQLLPAIQLEVESGQRIARSTNDEDDTDAGERDPFVTDLLRDRVDRSLEHVFRLLALTLDREPLGLALKALSSEDPKFRGTALEYLSVALPPAVRELLWPYLGETAPLTPARPTQELLTELAAAQ